MYKAAFIASMPSSLDKIVNIIFCIRFISFYLKPDVNTHRHRYRNVYFCGLTILDSFNGFYFSIQYFI